MSDLELRIYAMEVAKLTEGAKATTDVLLLAADDVFRWLKYGVFGEPKQPD